MFRGATRLERRQELGGLRRTWPRCCTDWGLRKGFWGGGRRCYSGALPGQSHWVALSMREVLALNTDSISDTGCTE